MDKMKYIFPGKFNPPHIGHGATIHRLINIYKDVIICVTKDIPDNSQFTPEEIAEEMKEFGIPVILLDGVLCDQKTNPFLSIGNVTILSGNQTVLNWADMMNIPCIYIPRSGNISSTKIRNYYE